MRAEDLPLRNSRVAPEEHNPFTSDGVSGASRRLRALAALSGSLTDALDPKGAADLVEQKALSALNATSAVVVTLGAFPPAPTAPVSADAEAAGAPGSEVLHVVHAIGLPAEVKAALEKLPLDAPVPLAEVARDGEPLFLPSEEEMGRYPDWATTMVKAGARAAAIVPVWANGELRGVLGLTWAEPREFDEDERAFVLTLGVMCAQAIMRAHLRAAERTARESAETARGSAEAARQTAEDANKSKADFVTTISHELRTPMTAVLGYTALLAEEISGPISATQREHINRVRSSGQHLLGLIEDLLTYARVEAGHEVVRPEAILLTDVVEASLALVRPLAEVKGLRISVEGTTAPIQLFTDARKLRQILVNLVANAIKFTDAGSIVLVLRVGSPEAEVRVIFEVTDTGPGMTPEVQAHVFDPFWQAEPGLESGRAGSSGLGLSVAQRLARLLGGDLSITKSAPGEGSTFMLSLPAKYGG